MIAYIGRYPSREQVPVIDWYLSQPYQNLYFSAAVCWVREKLTNRTALITVGKQDVWNMDLTLALIIHAMLKKFPPKEGYPRVDYSDVPPHIPNTLKDKWEYVLGEVCWVFENLATTQAYVNSSREAEALKLFGKYYHAFWD